MMKFVDFFIFYFIYFFNTEKGLHFKSNTQKLQIPMKNPLDCLKNSSKFSPKTSPFFWEIQPFQTMGHVKKLGIQGEFQMETSQFQKKVVNEPKNEFKNDTSRFQNCF